MDLILASGSPRRRELLRRAGLCFHIEPAGIGESIARGESPQHAVRRLAREKAACVAARNPDAYVLGADTVVAVGSAILGKPIDADDALRLLRQLSGRVHHVWTGVALCAPSGVLYQRSLSTQVRFHPLDESEMRDYADSGEGLDKAGAYALQGAGRSLVAEVRGSETNVIGLPLEETLAMLRGAGFPTEGNAS